MNFPKIGLKLSPQPKALVLDRDRELKKPLRHSGDVIVRGAKITGDIEATGRILIEDSVMKGSFTADSLDICNSWVHGDLEALHGGVQVRQGVNNEGHLLGSSVVGQIRAESGQVTVESNCEVQSVRAQEVVVGPFSEIGEVTAEDALHVGKKSRVGDAQAKFIAIDEGAFVENIREGSWVEQRFGLFAPGTI